MDVIRKVYNDLDAGVGFEEFETAVNGKAEQMGGLTDGEMAAMPIIYEPRDEEVSGIANIKPDAEDMKFLVKVISIDEVRTFERNGKDEGGRVVNIKVVDEAGHTRVSLWDEMAAGAKENLEVDTALRIGGYPKDGYNGVEVNTNKVGEDLDAEVDAQVLDSYRVGDLTLGLSDVNLESKILDADTMRTFDRGDDTEGRVSNLLASDLAGRVCVVFWDKWTDLAEELEPGQSVEVVDDYVRERDGPLELHVGSRGAAEFIDGDIEYVPEMTDIGPLELGQTVDITGGIIGADGKHAFDRDNGSGEQVRNVRVKDGTGDIRVVLWGEKADAGVDLTDYVIITGAEIKESWQEGLEISAGWRSSIAVTDEAPKGTAGTGVGGSTPTPPSNEGLGAFSGDGSSSGAFAANNGSSSDTSAVESIGEAVKFTGTVVQAEASVILDDGTQIKIVDTNADLNLGDEMTVFGMETDDRISIESVEIRTDTQQQGGQTAGRRLPIALSSAGC